jgi:hypothetical protein
LKQSAALHSAVVALRSGGETVYRAGAEYKVGRHLVTTEQLLAIARALTR